MSIFSRKHNQRVARIIKEQHLIEMTPEEVDENRKKAWDTIRRKFVERGYPEAKDWSDEFLLSLLQKAYRGKPHEGDAPGDEWLRQDTKESP